MKFKKVELENLDKEIKIEEVKNKENTMENVVIDTLRAIEKQIKVTPQYEESELFVWAYVNDKKQLVVKVLEIASLTPIKIKETIADGMVVQHARIYPKYKNNKRLPGAYFRIEETPKFLRFCHRETPFTKGIWRKIAKDSELLKFKIASWLVEISAIEKKLKIDSAEEPVYNG